MREEVAGRYAPIEVQKITHWPYGKKNPCQRIQSFLGDGETDTVCVVCDVERERMIESECVCVRENERVRERKRERNE